MAEYTYDDIIINPYSEEARNCIGKMVYYSDNPNGCLRSANNGNSTHCGILQKIEIGGYLPFVLENSDFAWACIMPKKEDPKPEYVPFSSAEEFINEYSHNHIFRMECDTTTKLDNYGMWLKYKNDYVQVTYIEASGINFGTQMEADWQDLYDNYTFLDGTPCGKLKEEKSE